MNEYITAVFNVVYILLTIALVDRLIELFRNRTKRLRRTPAAGIEG